MKRSLERLKNLIDHFLSAAESEKIAFLAVFISF